MRSLATTLLLLLACQSWAADESFDVFYFGNSYCENSIPWFHPVLAASAGHQMRVQTHFGPGWQVWMHVDTFTKQPKRCYESLVNDDWDGVVIHHFGESALLQDNVVDRVFDNQEPWPEPRDVSDFASSCVIIDAFLSKHPDHGRIFMYGSWPAISGAKDFKKRVRDEVQASLEAEGLPRDEVLKKVKEHKPTLADLTPLMEQFDYPAAWLATYEPDRETTWKSKHMHTRDYGSQLMELLRAQYPDLWAQKRLVQIPNGDVFLALDAKMRAGSVPGLTNIGFFSRDGGHIRAGLPRYTVAATCFAVMFGEHPQVLDYSIYNDLAHYTNERLKTLRHEGLIIGSGYIHQPDLGELLTITPELARIVNDTVWEVVSRHPYCGIAAGE